MGAEQIMPLSTAIDIVESMFFKEIAERYFDSSNIKDKTAAADEVFMKPKNIIYITKSEKETTYE